MNVVDIWIILTGVVIVAAAFFFMGFRLGMIAGLGRASVMADEIMEKKIDIRGPALAASIERELKRMGAK